ncbi:MAG: glycosyltransferase [Parabacteroides sp.]|nr:glycosyltransferase [Parabacteroides sp.]
MKICFYCDSIFSFGGVQRILAVLAKSLAKKHEITIITHDNPSKKNTEMYDLFEANINYIFISHAQIPKLEYFCCKSYSFLYKNILPQNKFTSKYYGYSSFPPTYRKQLIDIINNGSFDVLVGVHVFLSFHLASIKDKIHAKTIGWMHNSYEAFFLIKKPYIGQFWNYFKYQIPKLDKTIVLTKHDQTKYIENFGFEPEVIYNPLTVKPKGVGSMKHKKFLAVGRMSEGHKGFDVLIKAFAIFAKENNDWNLEIVGDGPEKGLLESLIKEYKLSNRIIISPFTNNIEDKYANASIFVLSSRWEGFGLVLLEAMAHGLIIISSELPTTKEILSNQIGAFFFQNENYKDLASKMIELINIDHIDSIKKTSIEYAASNSIEVFQNKWDNIFMKEIPCQ